MIVEKVGQFHAALGLITTQSPGGADAHEPSMSLSILKLLEAFQKEPLMLVRTRLN